MPLVIKIFAVVRAIRSAWPASIVPLCGSFSENNCHSLYDAHRLDLTDYLTEEELEYAARVIGEEQAEDFGRFVGQPVERSEMEEHEVATHLDYTHMMGAGEDQEEFFARLANGPGNAHLTLHGRSETTKGHLIYLFNKSRREYTLGMRTQFEHETILEALVREMLKIVGPVEPSSG